MTIRKLLIGTAAALLLATSPAMAKDLMLAVMDNGRDAKEIHHQMVEHKSCLTVIHDLKVSTTDVF